MKDANDQTSTPGKRKRILFSQSVLGNPLLQVGAGVYKVPYSSPGGGGDGLSRRSNIIGKNIKWEKEEGVGKFRKENQDLKKLGVGKNIKLYLTL